MTAKFQQVPISRGVLTIMPFEVLVATATRPLVRNELGWVSFGYEFFHAAIQKDIIVTTFEDFGLSNAILRALEELEFKEPTPIQRDAIPVALERHDIMGLAQTGTGKTAAFGLPLIHHLLKDDQRSKPREVAALIVAPTRELVKQIGENIREFTRRTPLRVNMVVGGASIHFQKKKLEKGTDILVATPGRLMDLVERKALTLDSARYLVLDEADQMLDLGFIHVLRKIAKMVGRPRQTYLFSATMPKQIEELANAFLENPVRIEVARSGKAADKVTQCVHFVSQGDKSTLLRKCLSERDDDLSLVFSRTKHGAEKLMKRLVTWGFHANSIHGNKSQGQREKAIKAFKAGDTRVLVATDVAARGIDIPGISHVYNFDLPEVPENYVHRIGRTARAGREGEAIAFCAPTEVHLLASIEKLMNMGIDTASGERPEGVATKSKGRSRSRGGQGKGGGNRSRNGPSNASGNGPNKNRKNKHRGPDKANEERSSYFGKSDGGGENRERPRSEARDRPRSENRERPRDDKPDYAKNKRPGRKRRFGSGDDNSSSEGQPKYAKRTNRNEDKSSSEGKPKFAKRTNRNDNKSDGNKQAPVRRKRAGKKRNKKKTAA